MTRTQLAIRGSVEAVSFLALALLAIDPMHSLAQEGPPEAPEAGPESASEVAVEEAVADSAAEEVLKNLTTSPGGVPASAADAETAVDMVKLSMAAVEQQERAGIGEKYVIQFGDTFDWVRLASGEWLKGTVKRMRDDTLEFDSDKLGMQNIDFADITHVHSPTVHTYVFDHHISATGRAVVTPEKVIVESENGTQTFDRSEMDSIISGGEREKDWWSMKLRFGLTLNRGNTEQLTFNVDFNTRREDELTLLDLSYNTTFGRTNGVQNVKRHLGELDFNVFLSDRWFLTPLFGQLFNDRFQKIQFRATPAAGAGVHIFDLPKVEWDFQTGVGYQYLKYPEGTSISPDGRNPQNDCFIPLFTYADFDITGDIGLTLSWLTNLVVTTIGNTNHTGKADLAIELNSVINLDIAFLFFRTEDPATSSDPDVTVYKNDYQLVVGVSLELG
jgi:putative salt-induced outer membrane protein YdiY